MKTQRRQGSEMAAASSTQTTSGVGQSRSAVKRAATPTAMLQTGGGVVKRSVTLAARNVEAVEEIVGRGEFSAFVDRALTKELERVRFDSLLDDLGQRHGAVTPNERVVARAALRRAGLELSAQG